jgi:hypothetical protein
MRVVTQNLWGWYYPLEGRGTGRELHVVVADLAVAPPEPMVPD